MGYFPRKRRRGTAREQVRAAHARSVDENWWEHWREAVPPPSHQRWFLRFSVTAHCDRSGQRSGIFVAAGLYEDDFADELAPSQRDTLATLLNWFSHNLPMPPLDEDRAVFFFKSDATDCARRIWELVHLLRDLGSPPEMVSTRNPGQIVYEDDFQVAAIPGR
jgi:hypothetical protein